ncbi:AraC family transcriptional regulator [Anaerocolumna cellulosilytica]
MLFPRKIIELSPYIAYRSGFNDSNYFSRQFQKHMGYSPRQYRNGKR